ncbi:MAG: hypothetical protein ABW321_23045 [Polyangiales bacterium]
MSIITKPIRGPSKKLGVIRLAVGGVLLGASLLLPLPTASVASAQDVFIEIEGPPRYYESRPHTVYRGQTVYWVDGHWYARRGPRWAYYRDEPRDLVRYREHYHYRERPRPAPHHHHHADVYDAPRARRVVRDRDDGPRGHHHHRDHDDGQRGRRHRDDREVRR